MNDILSVEELKEKVSEARKRWEKLSSVYDTVSSCNVMLERIRSLCEELGIAYYEVVPVGGAEGEQRSKAVAKTDEVLKDDVAEVLASSNNLTLSKKTCLAIYLLTVDDNRSLSSREIKDRVESYGNARASNITSALKTLKNKGVVFESYEGGVRGIKSNSAKLLEEVKSILRSEANLSR